MKRIEFYKKKEEKIIDPLLLSEIAESFAKEVATSGGKSQNKPSQIRKFFDEVVRLNTLAKIKKSEWDYILPLVHMIISKAAYAHGRNHLTENFKDFIKTSVDQVVTPEDLNVFMLFFESFIGFYKLYRPKD